jgi:hypothetical protein
MAKHFGTHARGEQYGHIGRHRVVQRVAVEDVAQQGSLALPYSGLQPTPSSFCLSSLWLSGAADAQH